MVILIILGEIGVIWRICGKFGGNSEDLRGHLLMEGARRLSVGVDAVI